MVCWRKLSFVLILLGTISLGGCGEITQTEEISCPVQDSAPTMEMTAESTISTETAFPVTAEVEGETTEAAQETTGGDSASGSEWYTLSRLIHHACGGIDKKKYTNSREAIEATLSQGNRLVEVDFLFTKDAHLICAHKWTDVFGRERSGTLEEFLAHKIHGKYSGITAKDIITYMEENPLLHIIVDTKEEDSAAVIAELLRLCDSRPEIADRFIVQLYKPGLKEKMCDLYPFRDENFLFTCYKFGPKRVSEILAVCREENIHVVTVPYGKWDQASVKRFQKEDILIFTHTVNDASKTDLALKKGYYGFYTDFLQVSDINLPEEAE